ncbi:NB-ARC domain-containing protein, partial [Magnetococcales bacterium HHB-1]
MEYQDHHWAEWIAQLLQENNYAITLHDQSDISNQELPSTSPHQREILLHSSQYENNPQTQEQLSRFQQPNTPPPLIITLDPWPPELTPILPKGVTWCDLSQHTPTNGAHLLLAALKSLLHPVEDNDSPLPINFVPIKLPFPRNERFLGRDNELQQISEALKNSGEINLTQKAPHTDGGVGKTTLALEYAHRHANDYQLIRWIRGWSITSATLDLLELAHELQLEGQSPQEQLIALSEWLNNHTHWLLILDDVRHINTLSAWPPPQGRGHLIITSRYPTLTKHRKTTVIALAALKRHESVKLLLTESDLSDEEGANEMADLIGDCPLSLSLSGHFIAQTQMDFSQLLTLDRQQKRDLYGETQSATSRCSKLVSEVIEIILDRIHITTPAAEELMILLSLFGPDDIPLKLFTFPPKPLIKKAISSLASLVRGPARKEEESAKERFSRLFPDQSQFDKTVRQLITFGLVRISEDSLSVHPVIQEYFRRV